MPKPASDFWDAVPEENHFPSNESDADNRPKVTANRGGDKGLRVLNDSHWMKELLQSCGAISGEGTARLQIQHCRNLGADVIFSSGLAGGRKTIIDTATRPALRPVNGTSICLPRKGSSRDRSMRQNVEVVP